MLPGAIRVRELHGSERVPLLPPDPRTADGRQLPQWDVGQAGGRDPPAELGHGPGGPQQVEAVH